MTAKAASRSGGGRRASDVATSGANNRRKKIKTGRVGEGNKNETIVAVLCVHEFEFATEELFLFGAVLNTYRRGGGRERALFAPLGMVPVTCSTSSLLGRELDKLLGCLLDSDEFGVEFILMKFKFFLNLLEKFIQSYNKRLIMGKWLQVRDLTASGRHRLYKG